MYLVDSSVWAEILAGSLLGARAKEILENNECFSLDIAFAELSKWCISNNFQQEAMAELVEKSSNGIMAASKNTFLRAGALWHMANKRNVKGRQIGLIDCIFAAVAEENNLTVLTKDRHFVKFSEINAEII